ncbi:hypothetical protein [Bradyrhizobium sp. SYSU BS000235]|uniref:hypothetical protein n=1 Tax=Bradyrhizobium sp. SYSU BS000235 TaxID=3411332 RepID=UPI003C738F64
MKKAIATAAICGLSIGGAAGAFGHLAWPLLPKSDVLRSIPEHPVWTEVEWPFAMDEWGRGKAFRCAAAHCGREVNLYIRAKIGFCNCTTGVSDDDELHRLSDFRLMGDKPVALGSGHPINVRWMKGRSRAYTTGDRSHSAALAIAFNDRCDAVVATVVTAHDRANVIEPSAIAFLNGDKIIQWATVTLGL